jgi:hypothetical protein
VDGIAERMADPELFARLADDLHAFIADYAENRDLLRFR